ncbi:MAG TPA: hypothetical protein V6C72_18605 [Chroococcales cyanobacterium]
MNFNTVYADLDCPFCKQKVESGVGFRLGEIKNASYRIGDKLSWNGRYCRPAKRPPNGDIVSVGYFNCDNVRCSTWQDCFPVVQQALITVKADTIVDVSISKQIYAGEDFDIIEPEGLS